MKRRTFAIQAGPRGRSLLAEAIRCFAEAAYPPGGSECAQVAREALCNSAAIIADSDATPELSTRQRVMLRQAVQWYCENIASVPDDRRAALSDALLRLLKGEPVDDGVFAGEA